MLFRYIDIDTDWNRDEQRYLQGEEVEEYSERVKAIKAVGQVMCNDGLVRDVVGIEYVPAEGGCCAAIEVFLCEK